MQNNGQSMQSEPAAILNVFFAVMADEAVWNAIAATEAVFRQRKGLSGKALAAARLHLSMNGLGNETPALLERALQVGDAILFRSFDLNMDIVSSFKGQKSNPLVLTASDGCGGLKMLYAMIGSELKRYGFKGPRSIGTPHMTLGYHSQMVERTEIEPIRWTANEFVLVRSHVGQSRYDILKRWPLKG